MNVCHEYTYLMADNSSIDSQALFEHVQVTFPWHCWTSGSNGCHMSKWSSDWYARSRVWRSSPMNQKKTGDRTEPGPVQLDQQSQSNHQIDDSSSRSGTFLPLTWTTKNQFGPIQCWTYSPFLPAILRLSISQKSLQKLYVYRLQVTNIRSDTWLLNKVGHHWVSQVLTFSRWQRVR